MSEAAPTTPAPKPNPHPVDELQDGDGSREPFGAPMLKPWPHNGTTHGRAGWIVLENDGEQRAPAGLTHGFPGAERMELGLAIGPRCYRWARYRRAPRVEQHANPYHKGEQLKDVPVFVFVGWRNPTPAEDPWPARTEATPT